MENCEPGQVRKEAALSGTLQALPGCQTGVARAIRFTARMAAEALEYEIRPALPGEGDGLSALALRSKAHWGYDDEFLERVRPLLKFTDADCASGRVGVLEVV